MLLRYYLDANNKRIYTTKMLVEQTPTLNAHPARFSPDDKFSKERLQFKARFNLLPIKIKKL